MIIKSIKQPLHLNKEKKHEIHLYLAGLNSFQSSFYEKHLGVEEKAKFKAQIPMQVTHLRS